MVEQGHGSIGCIHKVHKDLGTRLVALRAMIHQSRHLWAPDLDGNKLQRLRARLSRLQGRRGHVVMGRNMYYKDFLKEMGAAAKKRHVTQQEIMEHHVKGWEDLTLAQKTTYDTQARERTTENAANLEEDIAHVTAAIHLYIARASQESNVEGTTNNVANRRYSQDEASRVKRDVDEHRYPPLAVEADVNACLHSPGKLKEGQRKALALFQRADPPPNVTPAWLKLVCNNRDHFHNATLKRTDDPNDNNAYRMLYAKQQPIEARFLPMWERAEPRPVCTTWAEEQAAAADTYLYDCKYNVGEYSDGCSGMGNFTDDGTNIRVIDECTFIGDCRCTADMEGIPFTEFAMRQQQ